jgi:hypothetical protein
LPRDSETLVRDLNRRPQATEVIRSDLTAELVKPKSRPEAKVSDQT